MSKEKLELTRRRVLGGLGTIGVAGAAAGLGTSAYFNDSESFDNNVLTAGELDLLVDYYAHWDQGMAGSGSVSGTADGEAVSGNLSDVKPGDHGWVALCPRIDDNPAYLWACGELTSSSENGYTEPEPEDDNGEGELEEAITVDLRYCTVDREAGEITDRGDLIFSGSLRAALDQLHGGIPLDGTGDASATAGAQASFAGTGSDGNNPCVCLEWELPTGVGNEVQGDSLSFDVQMYAEQARHNDGTHNPCLEGETGEGFAKLRDDFSPTVNARGRFGDNDPSTTTGLRELDIRDASDNPEAQGGHAWSSGTTESFEVSYDGSVVTLDVGGDTISTSAVAPSDDDAAITVGASAGTVTVDNVEVNGQSPSGDDSVTASGGTRYLFLAGGGLAAGDSITGDVTFEWSGSPGEEGLKFRVDS